MYLHGAAVLTAIRIAIASTGATFSIVEGSVAATTDFSIMAIETFMPIFISLEKGLAGFEEMITIFVMNTMIGTVLSGLKYGIAT